MSATAMLGGRLVGEGRPTYLIAELSGNHNGDLGRAVAIVDAAADAGVDAIKLQTYTADSLTIDCDSPPFLIEGGTPWDGRTLHDLYREAATPWSWTEALFEHGRARGLDVLSTPFDAAAVELLEAFDPPAHKVASFELVDDELLRVVAATGRTIILSTGMASSEEIDHAIEVLRAAGGDQVILLRCVSAYPAPPSEMDLETISDMSARWDVPVGLSDHTISPTASIVGVALGACLIEKHITLSRGDPGPDSAFSLEPAEFRSLVQQVRDAEAAKGEVRYGPAPSEEPSRVFRRSLFVVEDVPAGAPFTERNVRSIRPGYGLAPRHLPQVLGRRARRSLDAGTPLDWDAIEGAP